MWARNGRDDARWSGDDGPEWQLPDILRREREREREGLLPPPKKTFAVLYYVLCSERTRRVPSYHQLLYYGTYSTIQKRSLLEILSDVCGFERGARLGN